MYKSKMEMTRQNKALREKCFDYCLKQKKRTFYGMVKDITGEPDNLEWCFYNPDTDVIYIRFKTAADMEKYIDSAIISRQ